MFYMTSVDVFKSQGDICVCATVTTFIFFLSGNKDEDISCFPIFFVSLFFFC